MNKKSVQAIVFTGLMVALGIVLSQIVSIALPNASSPIIKFGIGYLPIIIISVLYGPVYGILAAISQDLIGFFIIGAANGQIFHLGFTLNALLYGLIPGLFFRRHEPSKNKRFQYLNFGLIALFILLITLYLFNPDLVISSSLDTIEKYILMSVSLFAALILIVFNLWVVKIKKTDFSPFKILFIILLLYMIVSLVLTPIWLYMLINHMSFFEINLVELSAYIFVVLPLRIVKMPIEVMAYVLLLTPILSLLKRLINHQEMDEIDSVSHN